MALLRQVVICREGWYYLFVLAFVLCGAMLRDINLLMVVAGMMIGPLLYNARSVMVALRDIGIGRTLPESVAAGDLFAVDLVLTNSKRRSGSWAVEIEDRVQRVGGGRAERCSGRVLFSHVPPGQAQRQYYHGRLMRRGRYRVGPLKISTRFPFGLLRRTWTLAAEDTMTVFPKPGRLTESWRRLRRPQLTGTAKTRRQQGSMEGEFFALRDWQSGDSRRLIHWRTSARHGNLLIRQFEQQQDEDLVLLLDLWQPESPTAEQLDHVERAVRFAATLVSDLCRRGGAQIDFAMAGTEVHATSGVASTGLLGEILHRLAVLEAGSEDRIEELFAQGLQQVAPGASIVMISTRELDLHSVERRAQISEETRRRLSSQHLLQVDASQDQLLEYCLLD